MSKVLAATEPYLEEDARGCARKKRSEFVGS